MLTHFIITNAVTISTILLLVVYIFIALEKIPKATIALIGAGITILLGLVSQDKTLHDALNPYYFINYIDFNVIFLLVSMMIIVLITTKSGVFNWVANELLKHTKGRPISILFVLGLFTAVVSSFLDNVTTVILIMPITFAIAKRLDINAIPFLITEIFASNIGGTATLIGDPPNIIIGCAGNLSFMDFIKELTPVVVIILVCILSLMAFIFRKELVATPEQMKAISNIDNSNTITDKNLMHRSLFILGLVILGFITHDITHLSTSLVAFLGASVLLVFEKPSEIFKEIEWNTIFFFIGLFIIIGGLEASGGIKLMAEWIIKITQGSQVATSMIILWASGIISGIIDNIPYTATMAPMLVEIQKTMGADYTYPLWWALSLGACLGGNMTIIGAAANVIVSENARKEGYYIFFLNFLKYGIFVVLISLIISTIYVYLRFLI